MRIALFLLALAQDQDLESLLSRLDHDDTAVREQAEKDLAARGPDIVPKLLSLHRSTASAEVRARTENLLRRHPFRAFVLTRRGEPLHDALSDVLLRSLKPHLTPEGCRIPRDQEPSIEIPRLLIFHQSASGHGQYLALDQISPAEEGGLIVRRVAFQGTTPYRPAVREDGVRVEETRLDAGETKALTVLLQTCLRLRPTCAIEEPRGKAWSSSGSFSLRFRIESGGTELWAAAFSGYPGSAKRREYAHGLVFNEVLDAALVGRTWTGAKLLPEDRARALRWINANFEGEAWWIKEHYLGMARFAGDETFLPFLRQVATSLEGKEGPSEIRQLEAAKDALLRITGAPK